MKVKKLLETATIPTRAKEADAGYDLYAAEDVFIPAGETRRVRLGIAIELPTIGQFSGGTCSEYLKVEDRSSMASKGIRTGAGVVDAGYRGELQCVLHNLNNTDGVDYHEDRVSTEAIRGYQVKTGDKIAQGIISLAFFSTPTEVEELSSSDRGAGGFGSSGR